MKKAMLASMFALVTLGSGAREQDPLFRFDDLGEGVFAALTRDDLSPSSYANAVFVVGKDGAVMIDAHHAPDAAERTIEAFRANVDVPVRWLVLTHYHGDHVWGASAVVEAFPEVEILAHPATRDSLIYASERHLAAEVERIGGILGRIESAFAAGEVPEEQAEAYRGALARYEGQLAALRTVTVTPPTSVVGDRRTLDLGGREVVVIHPGPAHTRGDLVVWVPDSGFLAAGDLLEEAPLWLEGADVRGWAASLERLNGLGAVRVLPAHGRRRDDATLLAAHSAFLADAVRAVDAPMPPDSAGMVSALEKHREALLPFGVEGEAFESYVAAVRKGVPGG